MDEARVELLIEGLAHDDPELRVARLEGLSQDDLEDGRVLRAAIGLLSDDDEVVGAPDGPASPAVETAEVAATVGQRAERHLLGVGLPGTVQSARALAEQLATHPPAFVADRIVALVANTRWEDEHRAIGPLAPLLVDCGAPVWRLIEALGPPGLRDLGRAALAKMAWPALGRLLADDRSKPVTLETLEQALASGALELDPANTLALLAATDGRAPELARRLELPYPWAVGFTAIEDAPARARFAAWLATDPDAPDELPDRLEQVLRERGRIEGYPLADFLRWGGSDLKIVRYWDESRSCADVLRDAVTRWAEDRGDDRRAWLAVELLAGIGALGELGPRVLERLPEAPWDRSLFRALAESLPPIADLLPALILLLREEPARSGHVLPAIRALPHDGAEVHALAEGLVAEAEAVVPQDVQTKAGAWWSMRAGVDVDALLALAHALDDPALVSRVEGLLPRPAPRGA